jgi:outer membrane protein assembly factor BamD (BamD/ComL family)
MMLKPKKGISRKEMKEDRLVTTYFQTRAWVEGNRRLVTYIVSIPVILIAVWWFIDNNRRQSNERATTDLAKVYQLYDQGQYRMAIDGIPQENIRGLQSIVDDYGRTHSGEMAKLYLADAYFSLGDYDKSLKYFKDFDLSDKLLSSSALAGIASCYEVKGNHEEAANYYEQAASKYSISMQTPDDLFRAASNYSAVGKKDKAAELLRRLKREFPTSTYARDFDRFMVEFGCVS